MAAWGSLTQEQRDVYQAWERSLRAVAGEQARVNNHWAAANTAYTAQIQAILTALDDNTIVPNSSGLSGAQSLDSDAEAATIMAHGQGILTTYTTSGHRELWAKAAGGSNLIG